jgi:hypothetical protein
LEDFRRQWEIGMNQMTARMLCLTLGSLALTPFACSRQSQPVEKPIAGSFVEAKATPKGVPLHVVKTKPTEPHPVWEVHAIGQKELDAETQKLHDQLAGILTKSVTVVPEDRLAFYSAVNHPSEWEIERWEGLIRDVVAQDDGGYLVTAKAYPQLLNKGTTSVMSSYAERYLVSGDTVTYRGFLDPDHQAGKMPVLFGD